MKLCGEELKLRSFLHNSIKGGISDVETYQKSTKIALRACCWYCITFDQIKGPCFMQIWLFQTS